jgi:hypothetical protein
MLLEIMLSQFAHCAIASITLSSNNTRDCKRFSGVARIMSIITSRYSTQMSLCLNVALNDAISLSFEI